MRVVVIGGTGLISTAIVKRLIQKGHETVVYNRGQRSPGYDAKAVQLVTGDRYDFANFARQISDIKADAVIDMITFDADTAANSVEVFSGKVSHYLFCSTVCVYGGPLTTVPAMEDELHKPTGEYGANKSKAEGVFMDAFRKSKFPVTMFRPSHCYGEGAALLDIWGYSPALLSRLREGKPVIVPGDGHGLWQPGHVDDMAKGFVGALGQEATKGKAYNIVGDEVMTWREFHSRAAKALGKDANLVSMSTDQILAGAPLEKSWMLKEIFQYHAAYSNTKLKTDVPEYTDLISWEGGVKRTAEWQDKTGTIEPASAQPWVDALVSQNEAFLRTLAKGGA
jgi:nucleoside-diphosphate-sugar epimerase